MAFFGTPHRGGQNAKLGSVIANIVRNTLRHPDNNFMEAIKGKGSPFSNDLADKFRLLQQDYKILSFYETRPIRKFGMVTNLCYSTSLERWSDQK